MEEKRLNELICLHGQSMNQFPAGSDGQRVFADTVVILGAHAKLVGALKGLLARHGDGSEERPWAEWDTARAALNELGE